MTNYIYRMFLNDVVVAIFKKKKFATDFIDYQATISNEKFMIEAVK